MKEKYHPHDIELKWEKHWQDSESFITKKDSDKPKFYCLEMFPYPSGKIHMGHVRNYVIGDVIAHYKRMKGFNVLHPMGWDAFGMPAENAAIKQGVLPSKWTYENIDYMKKQLNRVGLSYDWKREVATCAPDYYRWNQWFFIEMFKRGLAYRKSSFVNWCHDCGTVLANEQVIENRCWRCDNEVVQKELEQWFFKITQYAEELLSDCDTLTGWPEHVVAMQRNWIGKSRGVEMDFPLAEGNKSIKIFTTRPDTLFGATFVCMAPLHPLAEELTEDKESLSKIKDIYGKDEQKVGLFTGKYAVNPMNGEKIPIYIANFVLMEYGTGAIMSVPAHDQRDFEFSKQYDLPVRQVIMPCDKEGKPVASSGDSLSEAFTDEGVLADSGQFTGLNSREAIVKMIDFIEQKELGKAVVNYKLRDWGISRQRYWGTPIPMVFCEKCGVVPVPESDLPVVLPEQVELKSVGGSPLSEVEDFVNSVCPTCGETARRETDTMDTFVDSSWYFIRYCLEGKGVDPKSDRGSEKSDIDYWMPVDQYIGGVEHAVLHLLYSRFFTRVLKDIGVVNVKEPFRNLLTQGMVCKETWKCSDHGWLSPDEVNRDCCSFCGEEATKGRIEKMSKSKKNVIDPQKLIEKYGVDTARLFILFAAPPDRDLEWSDQGVEGAYRFLNRVWGVVYKYNNNIKGKKEKAGGKTKLHRKTHQTIKKVTHSIEQDFHFNTAIAALMELLNEITAFKPVENSDFIELRFALRSMLLLLSPFAPHISEEIWQAIGEERTIFENPWPQWDEDSVKEEEIELVVQINGKVRAKEMTAAALSDDELKERALQIEKIKSILEAMEIKKIIVVKGKLVNIVAK